MSLKNELKEAAGAVEKAEGIFAQYGKQIAIIAGSSALVGFLVGLAF